MATALTFNAKDFSRIDERLGLLAETAQARVVVRSLNRAIVETRAEATRLVRAELPSLRAKTVRDRFRIERASPGRLQSELGISRKAIPLIEFGARQTKRGVSVRVKGSRGVVKGVFVATMPSGHRGVFRRIGGRRGDRKQELPIKELFGPNVLEVFQNHVAAAAKFGGERVAVELRRQIDLALK